MAENAQQNSGKSGANGQPPRNDGKREVRILMLHGYTQSGALFRAKTRALEKLMAKALAPAGLVPTLLYPTAPTRLSPRDIPGWEPAPGSDGAVGKDDDEPLDSWAWFRRDEASGAYRLLRPSMVRLAETIAEAASSSSSSSSADGGVIDGVIGFSQGGCVAGILAAAMEPTRPLPPSSGDSEDWAWVQALRTANRGQPLRFAAIYSGFFATPPELAWLYEPKITTPTLHVLGGLDTVVEEGRSRGLIDRCEGPVVVVHPGGHYVPVSREWATPLIGFIRQCMEAHTKL